jgi:hypothetical protein
VSVVSSLLLIIDDDDNNNGNDNACVLFLYACNNYDDEYGTFIKWDVSVITSSSYLIVLSRGRNCTWNFK